MYSFGIVIVLSLLAPLKKVPGTKLLLAVFKEVAVKPLEAAVLPGASKKVDIKAKRSNGVELVFVTLVVLR